MCAYLLVGCVLTAYMQMTAPTPGIKSRFWDCLLLIFFWPLVLLAAFIFYVQNLR